MTNSSKRSRKLKRMILIGMIVALVSQLYWNVFVINFRISTSVIALPEDFIEGMMCQGGCVGGPSNLKQEMAFKKDRDAVIAKADGRGVWENLKNYDMDSFSMHRSYEKPEA